MSTQNPDCRARTDKELRYLGTTVRELQHVREQQEVTVQLLRSFGASWGVIAAALGVSRQAARQHYDPFRLTESVGRGDDTRFLSTTRYLAQRD